MVDVALRVDVLLVLTLVVRRFVPSCEEVTSWEALERIVHSC